MIKETSRNIKAVSENISIQKFQNIHFYISVEGKASALCSNTFFREQEHEGKKFKHQKFSKCG